MPGAAPSGVATFTVTPSVRHALTNTFTLNYTLALVDGGVAPAGGYAFQFVIGGAGSGGTWESDTPHGHTNLSSSLTYIDLPAGQNTTTFRLKGTTSGDYTITVRPDAALGGDSVTVDAIFGTTADTPESPPSPGFTVSPASQSATTGAACGSLTVALDTGSVAPSGGLVFGLSTSESSGGSFSTGTGVTIPAGSASATFTYTSTSDGTFTLTVTPPSSGVSGSAQTVGVTFATPAPAPIAPASGSSLDVDVRLYSAAGTRLDSPDFSELSFEISERGGMQTGSIQFLAAWDTLNFVGTEYMDVRLFGQAQVLYRGNVRQPQKELGNPERSTPTLHGLMELLNGYLVRRDFVYAPTVSPTKFFSDLTAIYVTASGRMPGLQLDTSGVDALGLQLSALSCKGKTVPQCLNALCDLFPNELIWGGDVDSAGRNRLYLRPRASQVGYVYAVGGDVGAYVHPEDCTKIVNKIFVTGGKLDTTNASRINLIPNGSFEEQVAIGELTSNVLVNASFDDDDSLTGWVATGSVIAHDFGRTGNNACELNNDAANPEMISQDIPVPSNLTGIHAAYYHNKRLEFVATTQVRFELFSGGTGGTLVASSYQTPVPMPLDAVGYTYQRYSYDWTPPTGITYDTLRVRFVLASDANSGYAGQTLVDDCSVWFDAPNAAKSWRVSRGNGGAFTAVDWQNADLAPFDGDVCAKLTAAITSGSGHYAEIATTVADRIQAGAHRAYLLVFRVSQPLGQPLGFQAQCGVRIYKGGQLKQTVLGDVLTTPGYLSWSEMQCPFGSGNDCDALEPFLRVLTSGTCYVDGAGLYADTHEAPGFYSPDDTFRGTVDTNAFTFSQIGDAANSITTWGVREAEVSNENVINAATLQAFAISYLKAYGVPDIQARLTVKGAQAAAGLDGLYRITNLPSPPPPLPAARLTYRVGSDWIDIEAALNTESPSLENLFRLVAAGKI